MSSTIPQNYITLDHLQQTAAALLQKMYDIENDIDVDVDVNMNTFTDGEYDFQADDYGNLKVGTIEGNEIKIPYDWANNIVQGAIPGYSLSISNNRITLTSTSGNTSYIDLPVYNGGVT